MAEVHHRFATVQGRQLFYREAGPRDAPVLVPLHGFPSSSFMYRRLIPALADEYRLIAPDYPGFGFSDTPSTDEFDYTFDALTDHVGGLLDQLGVGRYALYVQDYGAPVGWRLALRNPDAITAVVTQSGNAYEEGFVDEFWRPIVAYQRDPSPDNAAALAPALGLDMIKWQYVTGVPDETLVDPDTWHHDHRMVSRPGNDLVQLKLLQDYATNVPLYPRVQEYLRDRRPPLLAVWGRNDPIFGPDGARAFSRDQPDAEVHLLDGGHFLLESALDEAVRLIRNFLGRNIKGS
ncbi:alpha/beta fold hydrolase [Streptomyces sp. TS71-3]|uniref:alpha/beta fold hydrolase n=1 Tax=Streptomyces sp. TS71-3 TaxID=2733862 RepID=UPI001B083F1A|nr:alpha/beta hydrolase [Streptomyces sp. TS71-3]GHJ36648.1 hydrolase [Streptomyces sp. TS71-3]